MERDDAEPASWAEAVEAAERDLDAGRVEDSVPYLRGSQEKVDAYMARRASTA